MKTMRTSVLSVFCVCAVLNIANAQKVKSDNGTALIAQGTFQCGMVPLKPLVPVQCSDLVSVCDTASKQWEWHCVPRTQPMQCGMVPLKPLVPVQCSDLVPECDTQSGKWSWICVARNGSITTGTYNKDQIPTTTTSTGTSSGTIQQQQNDIRAKQASEFQSGYAFGQQFGDALAVAIQRHHIRSYCKKHGDAADWKFEDGSIMSCASVNAGKPVREYPALKRQNDMQLQADGMRAYELMEGLRRGINDLAPHSDSPLAQTSIQESKRSWMDMRNMYCKANPGAAYTDLQGQQQSCP